jgi:hypothetical protein
MVLVNVDPIFLIELYIMVIVLGFVGVLAGFIFYRKRLGPAGMVLRTAKKKRTPVLLHEGRDGILRFWNTVRSFSGNWRAGKKREMTIIPESKSVTQIAKGPPMGVASSNGVATLPVKFLYYADRFVDYFLHNGADNMGPDQVAAYLANLRFREAEIRSILSTISRVQNHEISIEDAVNEMAAERGFAPDDEVNKTKLRQALLGAIESQGQSYRAELQRISEAKKIACKEGGWKLEWAQLGGQRRGFFVKKSSEKPRWAVKYVYTEVPVTLTNYIAFMPGATLDDLQTALLEAETSARLERTEDKSQQFRWITLGIVVFIIFIGMYAVLQAMKVF